MIAAAVSTTSSSAAAAGRLSCYHQPRPRVCLIRSWRRETWREQLRRLHPRTPTAYAERTATSTRFLDWQRRLWKHRALRLERRADRPSWSLTWLHEALCVHRFEGSWTEPGGLGPDVSGGMQIGRHEWLTFGGGLWAPEAYLAPPLDQLRVAHRYVLVSGWGPWPVSAERCGLL